MGMADIKGNQAGFRLLRQWLSANIRQKLMGDCPAAAARGHRLLAPQARISNPFESNGIGGTPRIAGTASLACFADFYSANTGSAREAEKIAVNKTATRSITRLIRMTYKARLPDLPARPRSALRSVRIRKFCRATRAFIDAARAAI
ncbi:hypothetical protein [Burkholderia sp. SRS-W-2-2016]|uniref:hypothetical protein n=1 Tax=Burkholderia sp. SRS-W-2-2016 TaxID=1926878 RepID=UPI00117C330E|nr:hypothetical protein [Burkholderia sp. SRS-W-2-2016]